MSASLPFPLPERWRITAARPFTLGAGVSMSVAAALAAGLTVWALARGDVWQSVILTVVFAALALFVGVGFEVAGGESGAPLLLNAVVLSRAQVRPPDSWIHFFRQRGPDLWWTIGATTAGVGASASLICAGAIVLARGGAWLGMLFLVVPLLLGALVVALAAVISIVQRWRHASFGRRPIGISVGRHGIIRYYLDGAGEWAWADIIQVTASVSAVDEQTGDFSPGVDLTVRGSGGEPEAIHFGLSRYQSHAWLIYTTLRFYLAHPDLRSELSTTYAQQRIEGWRDAISARRRGRA